MEDLEKQIRSFDEEKNRARIMEHHQQMGSYESGHACEAVCSWIKQKVFVRRTHKMSRFLKDTKKYYKYAIYSAKSKLQSGGKFLPELAVVGIGSDLFHADLHPDLWCGI